MGALARADERVQQADREADQSPVGRLARGRYLPQVESALHGHEREAHSEPDAGALALPPRVRREDETVGQRRPRDRDQRASIRDVGVDVGVHGQDEQQQDETAVGRAEEGAGPAHACGPDPQNAAGNQADDDNG